MSAEPIDLDMALAGPEPDFDTDPVIPHGLEQVDAWLRRVRRLQDQAAQVSAQANAEVARINRWEDDQLQRIARQEAWFTSALESYHRARLADDPKAKSIDLPNGSLRSRAQQPEWTFDEGLFLAWATAHRPELVRRKAPTVHDPEVDRNAAKKALAALGAAAVDVDSGEIVPGVTVTTRPPVFTIEVAP